MDSEQLNRDFGLDGQLNFSDGPGGFIYAEIDNDQAQARIATYAGQVLSYQPKEQEELLFVSDNAYFAPGKAIKGGIPICWPWFGNHASNPQLPAHGFVRNRQWQVSGSSQTEDGAIQLVLSAPNDAETQQLWPEQAQLQLVIEVGAELRLSMVTRNLGNKPLQITQALHTYFSVADIGQVSIQGLDGLTYLDATDAYREKQQQGEIRVPGEVNRIYTGVSGDIRIHDPSLSRDILIQSRGSQSAVVWKPWIDTAKAMGDLRDDDYLRMLCVETSNAGPDRVTLEAGETHRLDACYRIEQHP